MRNRTTIFAMFLALICLLFTAVHGKTTSPTLIVKGQPDLVVSKITVTPTGEGKNKVTIAYTVKNIGKVPSGKSVSNLSLKGNKSKSFRRQIAPLKPGESIFTTVDYYMATREAIQIKVSADYLNNVTEANERNNENAMRFGFSIPVGRGGKSN
ncbi:MAG: CARDB domain-containing protein [Candidatus Margulisbacteria bacterium]|nr:CARDB domain-containing protein [Candidatus Margulisiibacteriota bacterium]